MGERIGRTIIENLKRSDGERGAFEENILGNEGESQKGERKLSSEGKALQLNKFFKRRVNYQPLQRQLQTPKVN